MCPMCILFLFLTSNWKIVDADGGEEEEEEGEG